VGYAQAGFGNGSGRTLANLTAGHTQGMRTEAFLEKRWEATPAETRRLLAAFGTLGVALILTRLWILWLAERATPEGSQLLPLAPLALHEDVVFFLMLGLPFWLMHAQCTIRWVRRVIRFFAWGLSLLASFYAALTVEIFRYLKTPLTYRLLELSDHLRGIRASVAAALDLEHARPLLVVAVAAPVAGWFWAGLAQRWFLPAMRAFPVPVLAGLVAYVLICQAAVYLTGVDRLAMANAHLAMALSLLDQDDPFLKAEFGPGDLAAVDPNQPPPRTTPRSGGASSWALGLPQPGALGGHNVVLIVLESVGAVYLSLYGAPWETTPRFDRRVQEQGVVFQRAYAHRPSTSEAMVSLFCSVLPRHGWKSTVRMCPQFAVEGLAEVLKRSGYRTALFHTGDLRFDHEAEFLRSHGFDFLADVNTLRYEYRAHSRLGRRWQLPDRVLLEEARQWLETSRKSPFFLTLWTIQTHHPYVDDPAPRRLRTGREDLDRYLAAVSEADRLIDELLDDLQRLGLWDRTLVVVTADHGEAFGQHGHIAHGQTLYEEEVRIPLVFLHSTFQGASRRVRDVARQIDIAPTILDWLGLPAPLHWQGCSLLEPDHPRHVYLFTAYTHYLFGYIEEHQKYIYNATRDRFEVFDLRGDPQEQQSDKSAGEFSERAQKRLNAWLSFQNRFVEAHRDPLVAWDSSLPCCPTPSRRSQPTMGTKPVAATSN
jgi:arylsulfatase A-like enzyme